LSSNQLTLAIRKGILAYLLTFLMVSMVISFAYGIAMNFPSFLTWNKFVKLIPIFQDPGAIIICIVIEILFCFFEARKKIELDYLFTILIVIPPVILGSLTNYCFRENYHLSFNFRFYFFAIIPILFNIIALEIGKKFPQKNKTLEDKINALIKEKGLSPAEIRIIYLIIEGKQNTKIAQELFITEGTVKNHIYSIFKKLQIKSRTHLISLLK